MIIYLAFPLSKVTVPLFHSAAGSFQPEIIDKLASKRRDSPEMGFYYLKGFT